MFRHPKTKGRPGFTLIELLVVIAIIAVLIGLLVPAVQKVRDAADVTQSLNNLKQMSLATANMNHTYKMLPPGIGNFPAGGTSATVFYHLLPFIEQNPLYNNGFNATTVASVVALYQAAGDTSLSAGGTVTIGGATYGAIGYAANGFVFSGDEGCNDPTALLVVPNDGTGAPATKPFAILPRTFGDGTSSTIFYMEKFAICSGVDATKTTPARVTAGYEITASANYGRGWGANVGANPANSYVSNTGPIQLNLLLPQFRPQKGTADCAQPQGHMTASICIALADGSARSVTNGVSQDTWAKLMLPNDGKMFLYNDW